MKQQGAIRENSTGIRRVVVLGGPAAHRFTEAMHARGLAGWHITVLTDEAHAPYDRVALSRALTEVDADLTLGDPVLWAHAAVELVRDAEVAVIDPASRTVQTMADGESAHYPFDELVLATGSNAVRLGLPGAEHLHVYRTLEDVRALNAQVALLGNRLGRTVTTAVIGGGLHVVRLKGGDPFVFGRGGEEMAAAVAAGIPVTVVPGVSSATAVLGAAGISVTHPGTWWVWAAPSWYSWVWAPCRRWWRGCSGPGCRMLRRGRRRTRF
ncbi:nitrite reductase (NAD(P)H) large subunit [Arthrobacter sp. PAMC 25486]|nr:SAM-dependent methyltransferase [Arthrobacter sp. PAMC 25486]AIY03659.1 nitrite reductase (NAD(P)H) large subunit [Arthrobacter sp. PAMC 25486]